MKNDPSPQLIRLLAPRYWLLWLAFGILWLLTQLPYGWLVKIGRSLGRFALRFPSRVRHITSVNLKLCFPELSDTEREQLLHRNFESAGIVLFETALAWWAPIRKLRPLLKQKDFAAVQQALAANKGAVLCAPHFGCLELAGRLTAAEYPTALMYFPLKNALAEWINRHALKKHYHTVIRRSEIREVLRCLEKNLVVCYTPDVDPGKRNSLFIPFFGIPAASLTVTPRLAKMSGAAMLPSLFYRREADDGYVIEILPALENFPSEDLSQDVLQVNQSIEAMIRQYPEQYIWQYKRFKTRPEGEKDFYSVQKKLEKNSRN